MDTETILVRLERKVDALAKPKPFWVSADVVMEKTGWDKNMMFSQRKSNPDFYKIKKGGGFLYNINAIPETLLIKKSNP